MPLLGSFCLLFALALAGYCFVVGVIAAVRKDAVGYRLAETARRAGMASFIAVLIAAGALVYAALTDDFSVAYILHHSNRALSAPYKFAVLWSGQEGSILFWALLLSAYGFVLRLRHKVDRRLVAMASMVLAAIQIFFLILVNFVANPFGIMDRLAADGNGLNPLLQYPRDGDPSADALSRLRWRFRSIRVCAGSAHHAISRREMDTHYPPLDYGGMAIPHVRHRTGRALGLRRPGLGRILGLGPGRKRFPAPVAFDDRLSAFSHDAGKAWHDEGMERLADLYHLHALDSGNIPDPQRHCQFRTFIRAVQHR